MSCHIRLLPYLVICLGLYIHSSLSSIRLMSCQGLLSFSVSIVMSSSFIFFFWVLSNFVIP